jgi:hypothetical protein
VATRSSPRKSSPLKSADSLSSSPRKSQFYDSESSFKSEANETILTTKQDCPRHIITQEVHQAWQPDVFSHVLTKKLTSEDRNGIYICFSKEIAQFQRTSGHKTLAKTIISLEKY